MLNSDLVQLKFLSNKQKDRKKVTKSTPNLKKLLTNFKMKERNLRRAKSEYDPDEDEGPHYSERYREDPLSLAPINGMFDFFMRKSHSRKFLPVTKPPMQVLKVKKGTLVKSKSTAAIKRYA